MARKKHNKGCSRTVIRFKTRRGRVVSFSGTPGGSKKHGGKCGSVGAGFSKHAAAVAARRAFGRAARKCHGKSRVKRNACVRAALRA